MSFAFVKLECFARGCCHVVTAGRLFNCSEREQRVAVQHDESRPSRALDALLRELLRGFEPTAAREDSSA
jgi:hypothetical protein